MKKWKQHSMWDQNSWFVCAYIGCLTLLLSSIYVRGAHKTTLVTNFYLIVDHTNINNTGNCMVIDVPVNCHWNRFSRHHIPIYQFYMVIIIIIFECLCLLFAVWFILDIMLPITSHSFIDPRKQRVVKTLILNYGINSTSP